MNNNLINTLSNLKDKFYYSLIEKQIYKFKKKYQNQYNKFNNDLITIVTPTKNRSKILIDRAIKGVLS